ncbi:MAG TPA: hypothetical protein VKX41_03275 [Alloacidobacterium sp.]|nr:hypothetical protein [Alloacidobacterium sp.]
MAAIAGGAGIGDSVVAVTLAVVAEQESKPQITGSTTALSSAPCYRGPAINAKQIQCARQTLAKNALGIGLDVAGFIPGENLAVTVAQVGIGTVSAVNSAANGDSTGAFGSIAGLQLAALAPVAKSAGWGVAKSIPGIGTILNVGLTGRDLYNAYNDYQSCLAGH